LSAVVGKASFEMQEVHMLLVTVWATTKEDPGMQHVRESLPGLVQLLYAVWLLTSSTSLCEINYDELLHAGAQVGVLRAA
jgi:hypothetical protein